MYGDEVEDERYYMMEHPACQEIQASFQELFDDREGGMRKLVYVIQSSVSWQSWYTRCNVFPMTKILSGCLTCSLIDSSQVMTKVVVMRLVVMMMRMTWLEWIVVNLVFWKTLESRGGSGFFFL